jgi:putative phosphoribosyl transferase
MDRFENRAAAGRALAPLLSSYVERPDVLVLGVPRGGLPVAFEVAQFLKAPLDVLIVRKLGAPRQPEFALGAIASGGIVVTNPHLHSLLDYTGLKGSIIEQHFEVERREKLYRGDRGALDVRGRAAILVDDGAATGSSMLAAVRAVRRLGAKEVVVALPVASPEAYRSLLHEADDILCVNTPKGFSAVGQWYADFTQTTDEEVIDLMARAAQSWPLTSQQPRGTNVHIAPHH